MKLIILFLLSFTLHSQTVVKTIILRGQSNTGGTGSPAEIPDSLSGIMDSVDIFVSGAWQEYQPSVNSNPPSNTFFGPEINLSHKLKRFYGEEIRILKIAYGGTPLGRDDTRLDWNPNSGEYYLTLINYINAAQQSAVARGEVLDIIGAFYIEGEQDGKDIIHASEYFQSTLNIHGTLEQLMRQKFPFYTCTVFSGGTWRSQIRGYQKKWQHVESNNYRTYDGTHYKGEFIVQMGLDFFNVMDK